MSALGNLTDLVTILADRQESVEVRDDAAIDLAAHDEPEAMKALLSVAANPDEDDMVAGSAGESIAQIWERTGQFDVEAFSRLVPIAQDEIRGWLEVVTSDFPVSEPA